MVSDYLGRKYSQQRINIHCHKRDLEKSITQREPKRKLGSTVNRQFTKEDIQAADKQEKSLNLTPMEKCKSKQQWNTILLN